MLISRVNRRLRAPHVGLVVVQLLAVSAVFALVVGIAEIALHQLAGQNAEFARDSRAALLTQQAQLELADVEARLLTVLSSTPNSTVDQIRAGDAIWLADHLRKTDALLSEAAALNDHGAVIEAPIFHRLSDDFVQRAASADGWSIVAFRVRLEDLRKALALQSPNLTKDAFGDGAGASGTVGWAQSAIGLSLLLAALAIGLTGWMVGRRLNSALRRSKDEQSVLKQTTATVERRNEQLQALYRVVTEVTETLSLRYVTQTAVHSARTLVAADLVTLHLVRGDILEPVGCSASEGLNSPSLAAVHMGEGLIGRSAKRGRVGRVAEAAATAGDVGNALPGAESVIAVPMIVGARVVGVITCWSTTPKHFLEADERILEMMASQVATAVVAADTHEATEQLAHHDPLTGLPNRRQMARDIDERFRSALEANRPTVVAMIDIDHFKRFNDEFGHRVGDITLQRVSEVLRDTVRAGSDHVYRYGGEEFAIFMEDTTADVAAVALERVCAAVAKMRITGERLEPVGPVTVSIGYAAAPQHGDDPDLLLARADHALYQSKFAGRNRVTEYSAELESMPAAA